MWYDAANPKHAAITDEGKLTYYFPGNSSFEQTPQLDNSDITVWLARIQWEQLIACFRQPTTYAKKGDEN
jgi:hypothetical protein